jgi:hypothetical protein
MAFPRSTGKEEQRTIVVQDDQSPTRPTRNVASIDHLAEALGGRMVSSLRSGKGIQSVNAERQLAPADQRDIVDRKHRRRMQSLRSVAGGRV